MRFLRSLLFSLTQVKRIHRWRGAGRPHFDAIWGRLVRARVVLMPPAEARGYVRAYAAAVLRGECGCGCT